MDDFWQESSVNTIGSALKLTSCPQDIFGHSSTKDTRFCLKSIGEIGIIGLGKMGSNLALQATEKGIHSYIFHKRLCN